MTLLKTIATTCLAASGFAMAQESPVTAAAAGPVAPHTGLYTEVTKGNAAADNTVDDYSRRPTLIGDKQYVAGFGGNNLVNAAFAIQGMGLNWFGSVLALEEMSQIRAGLAGGTAWGAGAVVAVHRVHQKPAENTTAVTTYYEPSGIALFGDFNLGSSDLYGQVGWNTGLLADSGLQNSVLTEPATGPEDDDQNHTLSLMVGWKKDATTQGTHAFSVEGEYMFEMMSLENPTVDQNGSRLRVMPAWGYILRQNESYAVFLGANGMVEYIHPEDGNVYTLAISPNIAFEKQLSKGFRGFAGASVTGSWMTSSDVGANGQEGSELLTGGADMAVGLRWVKENFALEGGLKETVLANGPYLLGGNSGQGFFYNIGLSMGF